LTFQTFVKILKLDHVMWWTSATDKCQVPNFKQCPIINPDWNMLLAWNLIQLYFVMLQTKLWEKIHVMTS